MSEAIRWKKLEKIANDLMPFRCLICMEQVGSELQNRSKGYVIWKYCKNCGLEIEIRVTADQIQKAYDAPLEPVSIPIDVDAEIEAFLMLRSLSRIMMRLPRRNHRQKAIQLEGY